jgi:prefoldin beta subunit
MNEETQEKIQEMQTLEQQLQQFLMQKQALQTELVETDSASSALKKSSDEVYKLIGQLLIKVDKKDTEQNVEEKKKLIETRLESINKQESSIAKRIESLREEVMKEMNIEKEKAK